MKAILLAAALIISVVTVYAGEGLGLSFLFRHYDTLTNTANFHEMYSTTNMPPKLLQSVLKMHGGIGLQAEHRRVAEPTEPLIHGSRLVWAATDTTNWVVHYEYINTGGPTPTNYCVFAYFPSTNAWLQGCNGGYMRRFKDYKEFITYETHLSSNP